MTITSPVDKPEDIWLIHVHCRHSRTGTLKAFTVIINYMYIITTLQG